MKPLVWLLATFSFTPAIAGEVTLASPGKPPVIIAPTQVEDQVRYALDDLQKYLHRILNADVSLAEKSIPGQSSIFIGDVPTNADLKPLIEQEHLERDGFVLDVSDQGIRILGGSKFGTAYGIYELLERLGVRWLFPGEWGEVVPQAGTLTLPAERFIDKPAFTVRRMATNYSFRPLHNAQWVDSLPEIGDWKRRNRHNTSGYFGHSNLIPTKTYGAAHPEWFAEIDGKRVLDPNNWKLCHSNPTMVQQAIADTLKEIRARKANAKPQMDDGYRHSLQDFFIISVGPTDGGGFCRCAECQKMGSLSDRLQIFANTIADAVRKEFPDYWVGYYAIYSEAQMPPTVKAHPGVMAFTTAYTKVFFSGITDTANNTYREKLEGFNPFCPNKAMGDFDGISEWWGYGPLSYLEVHQVDYPWYLQRGLQGISTHANLGWAAGGYSWYITSKLWWHPDADIAALRHDFAKSGFGEAAAPMEHYYESVDKARVWPSPDVLFAMRQDLNEATALAKRPDVKLRLDYLRTYHLLLDAYTRGQEGTATAEDLSTAVRVCHSIDYTVTALNDTLFAKMMDAPPADTPPYTRDELHALLDRAALTKPGKTLSTWADGDDLRLTPMAEPKDGVSPDMGTLFRWGPETLLIYAKANERIKITQQGTPVQTDYELRGPEQTVIENGTSEKESIIDRAATTEGIHTFIIHPGTFHPRIQISNHAAVIKASGSQQCLKPTGNAILYFYVPKGVSEFAFVTRAKEPLTLTVWSPADAKTPVLPPTTQKIKVFQEHRVKVPASADGKVWSVKLTGADRDIFLQGIPPFLASDPSRLLILK